MDRQANVLESQPSLGNDLPDRDVVIIEDGDFTVREMILTLDKLGQFWGIISKFRTLFSDLTKNDMSNFLRFVTESNSMWLEVWRKDEWVGIVCLTNLYKVIDTDAHLIFWDHQLKDKVPICKKIMQWTFKTFPLQRITVEIPKFYYSTTRLVEQDLGFKFEGEKRNAVLIEGRWANVRLFGITRADMEARAT